MLDSLPHQVSRRSGGIEQDGLECHLRLNMFACKDTNDAELGNTNTLTICCRGQH